MMGCHRRIATNPAEIAARMELLPVDILSPDRLGELLALTAGFSLVDGGESCSFSRGRRLASVRPTSPA